MKLSEDLSFFNLVKKKNESEDAEVMNSELYRDSLLSMIIEK